MPTISSTLKMLDSITTSLKSVTIGDDDYMNTLARLDLINNRMQTTAELQNKIFAAANDARGSYSVMADSIARMGSSGKAVFKSNDELVDFSNLMQKSFRIGGAGTQEQKMGMDQLTQSMISGKLQGNEFDSVTGNNPVFTQALMDYTGKSQDDLRQMSAQGEITADVIKNAMFSSADQINQKFEAMPKTFGDMANLLGNYATRAFQPVIQRISSFLNSDRGAQLFGNLEGSINAASIAANNLLTVISAVYSFMSANWSLIAPVIMGIVFAFTMWKLALIGVNTVMAISNELKSIAAARELLLADTSLSDVVATKMESGAQIGLNAALLACPITWIILGLIVLIAIIYLVVAAINHFAGTSISATGIVFGVFALLGVAIWNIIVGVINSIIQFLWTRFVEPWIGIVEFVLNVFNGGFNSFGDAVKNLIGQIISWFLSLGKVVTQIIDAIFGTNWTTGLESLQGSVLSWGKNDKAITLDRTAPSLSDLGITRAGYGDTWNGAYSAGDSLTKMFDPSSFMNQLNQMNQSNQMNPLNQMNNQGIIPDVGTVGQVNKVNDTVDISSEDLKTMRELAEMKNIQNFVTLTPTISVQTGDIRNGESADTLVDKLKVMLMTEIASSASAAYS